MKGLMVNVYRSGQGDSTNGGVSSKSDALLLYGEGVAEVFEHRPGLPVVKLIKRTIFGKERIQAENNMFGGNFIYSSDSRFPSQYPIPVHDRVE